MHVFHQSLGPASGMLSEVFLQKFRIRVTCSTVLILIDFGTVQAVKGEQHIPIHFSPLHPI